MEFFTVSLSMIDYFFLQIQIYYIVSWCSWIEVSACINVLGKKTLIRENLFDLYMQQKDTRDPGHIAYLSNNSEQKH